MNFQASKAFRPIHALALLAVGVLVAALGCMKPGDGMGLDANGRVLPPKPVDSCTLSNPPARCIVPVDSCTLANPPARCTVIVDSCTLPNPPSRCNALPANYFADNVLPIFANNCETCHKPGGAGYNVTGMDLSAAVAYSMIVNMDAKELLDNGFDPMKRILPGKLDSSYLYMKITKTSPTFGGRMPLNLAPLSQSDIDIIKTWILGGAPQH